MCGRTRAGSAPPVSWWTPFSPRRARRPRALNTASQSRGGPDDEFEKLWSIAVSGGAEYDKALADRTYSRAGGGITYLVSGRKPG
jgi:hypothetical protein